MDFGAPGNPGAELSAEGVRFTVRAPSASSVALCLFDQADNEIARHDLEGDGKGFFSAVVPGVETGAHYGLRASGPWQPEAGHRFDPSKLLVDPYAVRLDRPFTYDPRLDKFGEDTQHIVPKAILEAPLTPLNPGRPCFEPGGLIYEIPVRAFSRLHPDVPEAVRGTLRALAHPAIIEYLRKLHVNAVELMPIAAWIDERHLPRWD